MFSDNSKRRRLSALFGFDTASCYFKRICPSVGGIGYVLYHFIYERNKLPDGYTKYRFYFTTASHEGC
jgi:hypothetical protein